MKQIIIGGVPRPIGGVTSYLRRLLHRDSEKIDIFLDFYSGNKEPLRQDCQMKVVQLGNKFALLKWLWTRRKEQAGRNLFFNFSTPKALFLTLIIPKVAASRWAVMLHHGNLVMKNPIGRIVTRLALSRFDEVKSLSETQTIFYKQIGVKDQYIAPSSSYCEPVDHIDLPEAVEELNRIRMNHRMIIVMSGFPIALYNFELGIAAVAALKRDDCALCLFIYGPGELRESLKALARKHPWLYVFDQKSETYFNTALKHSDLLMRLTETDSFGISVWDASYWNIKVIASDVCIRPTGTIVVDEQQMSTSNILETKLQKLFASSDIKES